MFCFSKGKNCFAARQTKVAFMQKFKLLQKLLILAKIIALLINRKTNLELLNKKLLFYNKFRTIYTAVKE